MENDDLNTLYIVFIKSDPHLKQTDMGEILTPGQWDNLRIHLKKKHPDLTDEDMPYYEAEEQDMLCMIEYKIRAYRAKRPGAKHNNFAYSGANGIDG